MYLQRHIYMCACWKEIAKLQCSFYFFKCLPSETSNVCSILGELSFFPFPAVYLQLLISVTHKVCYVNVYPYYLAEVRYRKCYGLLLSLKGIGEIVNLLDWKGREGNKTPLLLFLSSSEFFLLTRTTRNECQAMSNYGKVPVKLISPPPSIMFSIQTISANHICGNIHFFFFIWSFSKTSDNCRILKQVIISFLSPKINIFLQFQSAPEWAHYSWYYRRWQLKANCIDRPLLNKIAQQEPSRSNYAYWNSTIILWYSNNEKSNH